MTQIDLPRPVEAYFAFAELPPGRQGRRFTITFTYFEAGRLDRLQWWWQASAGQLRVGGEVALEALRREAIERFRAHIETWLLNSARRITGGDPFPQLEPLPAAAVAEASPAAEDASVVDWPGKRAAKGQAA